MRELPPAARVYLVLSYLLGLGALGWLLLGGADPVRLGDWLLGVPLVALAAVVQVFVVKRARGDHSDHLTPAPLFAAFLLLPHPLLALVVVFAFVPEWIYYRRKWFIQCLNIASWLIALAGAKVALFAVGGRFRLEGEWSLPALAVLVAMGVFLGLQTFLLAWALKLASGHSLRESGLFAPGKLFVEGALLCSGWSFAIAWVADPLYGLAAAVPLALIFQALHVPNLKEEAATDPKTGLANMRHFNQALARALADTARSGQPNSLLMCDLDYLRHVNNTYGHQAGDVVLQGISEIIKRTIRTGDTAGRFGGEEFVVLLVGQDQNAALRVAERVRSELEASRHEVPAPEQPIGVTISIGVATAPEFGHTAETLLRASDLAVYQAKREGRNRVVAAGQQSRELQAEWAREHLVSSSASPAGSAATKPPFWRPLLEATRLAIKQ
ncbi:MAG: GGDEF domain-containing protein, partial [Chloroflexota bacterium]|nr:GGDEF domain-containing protein [Chloroflexota bacterium]